MTPSSDATPPIPQPDGTQSDATTARSVAPQDARRRRLLKGLIGVGTAVPMIFTLQRSGRAAFFGSNQACLNDMPDASTITEPCQTAADDKVRAIRSSFINRTAHSDPGDAPNYTLQPGTGTPATDDDDMCLVYYHPDSGWFPHGTSEGVGGTYGRSEVGGGYKVMTYSCWTSLHNTPGSTSDTGHP
ncbi:hypothetical protein SIID45300_00015 [Candidatus Magnetaquicoccaceae bacterium FCR-1]|uniref:Uncharacterized protein n=1 Tax=Candidatus Magnetaquiglobus chichijimensis TaxID=3141448 RepID=A0ABQ0C4A0_9PROT